MEFLIKSTGNKYKSCTNDGHFWELPSYEPRCSGTAIKSSNCTAQDKGKQKNNLLEVFYFKGLVQLSEPFERMLV